jgi:hypothetical protein
LLELENLLFGLIKDMLESAWNKRIGLTNRNERATRNADKSEPQSTGVKKHLLLAIISFAGLAFGLVSCQRQYYYTFPQESQLKGISPDSVKWKYDGPVIVKVPVADNRGKLFWLDVTPTTKLEVTTVYGDTYRFYLRTITIANAETGILGTSAQWSGYDIREHAVRTVQAREISRLAVIADVPTTTAIQ